MYKLLLSLCGVIGLSTCHVPPPPESRADFTRFVNPFIGTDGTGHTFPGPCMPFGMVQPGPDNRSEGWDYTSGYQLKDSTILGFSQTRASGTGISEFGDVLLLPFVGQKHDLSSRKVTEHAAVGYYSVLLDDQTLVELTATQRVAMHRYTFAQQAATVLVDLQHGLRFLTDSLVLESDVRIESPTSISGYCHTKNWVTRKYFFVLEFDTPFTSWTQLPRGPKEQAPRYLLNFNLAEQPSLMAKIALSTVSVEGAKRNLHAELPHWDFEKVRQVAAATWNQYLSRIEITAPAPQQTIFYTAMYHLFIQPSNIADVDGSYRGANDQIAVAPQQAYYSTLSLWDTYRAAHPLYTLIATERVDGFVQTMLAHHQAQGYLPIWTAWGQENHCMIGNHAIPVITDAYVKGFRGFDPALALNSMVTSTTENHLNSDWALYNQYGYYPFDRLDNESVSRTLESGLDDYCVALLAEHLGDASTASTYYARSKYYQNLFDSTTLLMRGKDTHGNFRTPFHPLRPTSPMNNPGDYTEANAWQYTWATAQYDLPGLMALMGGKTAFTNQLDLFFTLTGEDNKHLGQEGMIGQYAHGNEPSHHIAYLYAYSSNPRRGQDLLRQIYQQFYHDTPNGITGNEDCGQMSAWYIFTTLGFYPVNPANGQFTLGIPQVSKAIVHLDGGKQLTITNPRTAPGEYINHVWWNNQKISSNELPYQQIMAGGELRFE